MFFLGFPDVWFCFRSFCFCRCCQVVFAFVFSWVCSRCLVLWCLSFWVCSWFWFVRVCLTVFRFMVFRFLSCLLLFRCPFFCFFRLLGFGCWLLFRIAGFSICYFSGFYSRFRFGFVWLLLGFCSGCRYLFCGFCLSLSCSGLPVFGFWFWLVVSVQICRFLFFELLHGFVFRVVALLVCWLFFGVVPGLLVLGFWLLLGFCAGCYVLRCFGFFVVFPFKVYWFVGVWVLFFVFSGQIRFCVVVVLVFSRRFVCFVFVLVIYVRFAGCLFFVVS